MNLQEMFDRSITEPNTGCWVWLGAMQGMGYGEVYLPEVGRSRLAHRVAFECVNGEIPAGMTICHRCDLPICINPDHLFVGTQTDNMRDMAAKGRGAGGQRGSRHHSAKITEGQALLIRDDKRPCRVIAKEYGIGSTQVHEIKSRKAWGHLP